ncbi:hypothetical protein D8674_041499 [Pyrus ussuriensis x Pyrus communis]|uniref:S-protein homolog n=1 Tax=Pyrus ussuriensis x Pyrus communis TaxID=2448454 RepID=A0A5N5G7G4_9ROSA|nr:hypothetical protein D8674_041499 [Pyrus ussuriensis x Pyrus communis]
MAKASVALLMILSLLLLLSECSLAFDTLGMDVPKRVVNITNYLGPNIVLTLHCKSNDDDLGKHDLSFENSFHWEFKSNALFPNTVFYCYMWWQDVYGSFDVYKAQRDDERCGDKCWWRIKQTGAFSFDESKDRWDLMYIWQK